MITSVIAYGLIYVKLHQYVGFVSKDIPTQVQSMETVLRKTRKSTGVNCRNVRRRVRCQ